MDLLEDVSVLSWNIMGALGKETRCQVRDIINSYHPSLVFLYETHGVYAKVERMWLSLGYNLVFIQEAVGYSSRIWTIIHCY